MKSRSRRLAKTALAQLAPACVLLLAPLLSSCQTTPKPSDRAKVALAPAHYFDAKTGIYFPGALGKLYRKPIVRLEDKKPGLGLAITYRSFDARIDVFVYDLQASIIPVGIEPDVIRQSFESSLQDFKKATNSKLYRNLQLAPTGTIELAGLPFLHAKFTYHESLLPKEGQLLVAGVNGQILKIRAAKTQGSPTDLDRLLGYLGNAIVQSQRNGYGGIDDASYRAISQNLQTIDLADGLSETEAIAIAQIELVDSGQHNRYDATLARITENSLPNFAIVAFPPYPSASSPAAQPPVRIMVQTNGDAYRLATET